MDVDAALVGEDEPHEGGGEEAGFVLCDVGGSEGGEDHDEGEGVVEKVGDPMAPEAEDDDAGPGEAEGGADGDSGEHGAKDGSALYFSAD